MSEKPEQKKRDLQSLPTKQYLDQTVAPILLQGLQTLAKERPPDPISFLAAYLLKHKGNEETVDDEEREAVAEVTPSSVSLVNVNHTNESSKAIKRSAVNDDCSPKYKRIKPTLISSSLTSTPKKNEGIIEDDFTDGHNNNRSGKDDEPQLPSSTTNVTENPITEQFAKLIQACRFADASSDMDQLINKKLLKYYHLVHPDFVNSRSFGKVVAATTEEIQSNPKFVYMKLSKILEELNIRRKSGQTVMTNEEVGSTGDERRDNQIKRLNKALYVLKKKIAQLETSEVDLDDETNSLYILTERYKKRACEIYEKICDITGESKHALRLVKKPIAFNGTKYPQFNRTMQSFVNQTGSFPDLFDVLRILEHCNQQFNLKLGKEEIKTICKSDFTFNSIRFSSNFCFPAQDAFVRIGKLLQKRRKTDLYETVSFFTEGTERDPAGEDAILRAKLEENRKHHTRINDLINKYAEIQDKSSDISIVVPSNVSNAESVEFSQNNKENEAENKLEATIDDEELS
ncbi:Daxx-like protein [Pseudolycoriella hygida]|uniref:Daxx-like protein n=1 Tax=Pseudolycoriella hygida TaxID=35572 RepID=A0A9Q0SAG9_9DIPT|nr:Daxx-like protein [Pseudolycoriella hygida]